MTRVKRKNKTIPAKYILLVLTLVCFLLMLGSFTLGWTAGPVGTAASYVFFLDLPWTYANYDQACCRAYRIGTKSTVNIISLNARGTIDDKIWKLIHTKKDMSDFIVDGKIQKLTKEVLLDLIAE